MPRPKERVVRQYSVRQNANVLEGSGGEQIASTPLGNTIPLPTSETVSSPGGETFIIKPTCKPPPPPRRRKLPPPDRKFTVYRLFTADPSALHPQGVRGIDHTDENKAYSLQPNVPFISWNNFGRDNGIFYLDPTDGDFYQMFATQTGYEVAYRDNLIVDEDTISAGFDPLTNPAREILMNAFQGGPISFYVCPEIIGINTGISDIWQSTGINVSRNPNAPSGFLDPDVSWDDSEMVSNTGETVVCPVARVSGAAIPSPGMPFYDYTIVTNNRNMTSAITVYAGGASYSYNRTINPIPDTPDHQVVMLSEGTWNTPTVSLGAGSTIYILEPFCFAGNNVDFDGASTCGHTSEGSIGSTLSGTLLTIYVEVDDDGAFTTNSDDPFFTSTFSNIEYQSNLTTGGCTWDMQSNPTPPKTDADGTTIISTINSTVVTEIEAYGSDLDFDGIMNFPINLNDPTNSDAVYNVAAEACNTNMAEFTVTGSEPGINSPSIGIGAGLNLCNFGADNDTSGCLSGLSNDITIDDFSWSMSYPVTILDVDGVPLYFFVERSVTIDYNFTHSTLPDPACRIQFLGNCDSQNQTPGDIPCGAGEGAGSVIFPGIYPLTTSEPEGPLKNVILGFAPVSYEHPWAIIDEINAQSMGHWWLNSWWRSWDANGVTQFVTENVLGAQPDQWLDLYGSSDGAIALTIAAWVAAERDTGTARDNFYSTFELSIDTTPVETKTLKLGKDDIIPQNKSFFFVLPASISIGWTTFTDGPGPDTTEIRFRRPATGFRWLQLCNEQGPVPRNIDPVLRLKREGTFNDPGATLPDMEEEYVSGTINPAITAMMDPDLDWYVCVRAANDGANPGAAISPGDSPIYQLYTCKLDFAIDTGSEPEALNYWSAHPSYISSTVSGGIGTSNLEFKTKQFNDIQFTVNAYEEFDFFPIPNFDELDFEFAQAFDFTDQETVLITTTNMLALVMHLQRFVATNADTWYVTNKQDDGAVVPDPPIAERDSECLFGAQFTFNSDATSSDFGELIFDQLFEYEVPGAYDFRTVFEGGNGDNYTSWSRKVDIEDIP